MRKMVEVEKIVGLKRREIQEYEKGKLLEKPTERNKYGYLLYSDSDIERLWQLRFYKELGYRINDIKALESKSGFSMEKELDNIIEKLEEKKQDIENMINIAKAMKSTGLSFNSFKDTFGISGNFASDYIVPILGLNAQIMLTASENGNEYFHDILTEEDMDEYIEIETDILDSFNDGCGPDDPIVQELIKKQHHILSKQLSESLQLFRINYLCNSPDSEMGRDIDELYGPGYAKLLIEAYECYYRSNEKHNIDNVIFRALERIEELGHEKYTTGSPEVQAEVRKIHSYYKQIPLFTEKGQYMQLRSLIKQFGSKAYMDAIDNGNTKGISWFISRAVEIYCDNLEKPETI